MKTTSFRAGIAITTFLIGVTLTAIWIQTRYQPTVDATDQSQPISVTEESDKYAVYSVVLNEVFVKDGFRSLIIFDKTAGPNSPEALKANFSLPVDYNLVDEGEYKNYVFADEKDHGHRDSKKIISDLTAKLPKPIADIRLSRVTFNDERTVAEVTVEYVYCPLCGFGKTASLEKVDGVWKIRMITDDWVS